MAVFSDTHGIIRKLATEGGMTERGAEILITALNEGLSGAVATKADLDILESRLSNKMYALSFAIIGIIVSLNHYWK